MKKTHHNEFSRDTTASTAAGLILILWAALGIATLILAMSIIIDINAWTEEEKEYNNDYGLASVVTTTAEYEYLTNDSFDGVVVRGATGDDPALTIRNREGEQRRIAAEFLEPVE